ncbi:hypothetical protein [Marinobacter xestospongiae]|uniref:Uncharacterized protein n=1 Tax=Marinobacter xestospongiae TaxID=994319 RepID=A0ABU3VTF7_9GAMM|nr:hypothetical protein [Marinobacter xestospongiae]MDV2077542.1 hypothetical protein [Marinobacter xestospongiae]
MNGLIELGNLYFPDSQVRWPESWWSLENEANFQLRFQELLHSELSSQHPLWGLKPVVLAKNMDELIVHLSDGNFAVVHIIGSGKVDQFPEKYPSTYFFKSLDELQSYLDDEA